MDLTKALNLNDTVTFSDEYNGEKFSFTAKKNVLSPLLLQTFTDVRSRPIGQAEILAGILTDWDIEKDGAVFPPNVENLSILPTDFLWQVFNKIAESWSGNEQRPDESVNGSAASAK